MDKFSEQEKLIALHSWVHVGGVNIDASVAKVLAPTLGYTNPKSLLNAIGVMKKKTVSINTAKNNPAPEDDDEGEEEAEVTPKAKRPTRGKASNKTPASIPGDGTALPTNKRKSAPEDDGESDDDGVQVKIEDAVEEPDSEIKRASRGRPPKKAARTMDDSNEDTPAIAQFTPINKPAGKTAASPGSKNTGSKSQKKVKTEPATSGDEEAESTGDETNKVGEVVQVTDADKRKYKQEFANKGKHKFPGLMAREASSDKSQPATPARAAKGATGRTGKTTTGSGSNRRTRAKSQNVPSASSSPSPTHPPAKKRGRDGKEMLDYEAEVRTMSAILAKNDAAKVDEHVHDDEVEEAVPTVEKGRKGKGKGAKIPTTAASPSNPSKGFGSKVPVRNATESSDGEDFDAALKALVGDDLRTAVGHEGDGDHVAFGDRFADLDYDEEAVDQEVEESAQEEEV